MITTERLRELFDYDPIDGVFRRTTDRRGGFKAGSIAGWQTNHGYTMLTIDDKKYYAHRLVWLHVHGRWPRHEIDHINGFRNDNRLINLREATSQENKHNARLSSYNTSGFKGVTYHVGGKKWQAQIVLRGQNLYLGLFSTPEAAHAARNQAAQELHGKFAHGG